MSSRNITEILRVTPALQPGTQDDSLQWFTAPWVSATKERTYGGQLIGQAVAAASATVEGKEVHSLHSYFLVGGDSTAEVDIEVELLRDGGSFAHRRVRIIQHGRDIFHLMASFHRQGDTGPEHGQALPVDIGPAESGPDKDFVDPKHSWVFDHWTQWEARLVPPEHRGPDDNDGRRLTAWIRYRDQLEADFNSQAAALGYISDATILHTARAHELDRHVQMASLDHSMWFFRPFRVDEWLLYDQSSPAAGSGRGFGTGRFFNQDGELVAMATQEGLIRDHLK